MIHLISVPFTLLAGFFVGYRWGSKGLDKLDVVRDELYLIEREVAHDAAAVRTRVTYVIARLKKLL